MSLSRFHPKCSHLNARESIVLSPGSEMEREENSCSKQQSRNSPAAHGEDHGGAGCFPAAHRGPQWSRSSHCSVWKTPWVLQLLSLLPGLQLRAVKHQTSVSTHHNKFWLYFFPDCRIQFFHILLSFSLVEKIRNTGILCSRRHFYRNKCLYNFCIHKLIISTQVHFRLLSFLALAVCRS